MMQVFASEELTKKNHQTKTSVFLRWKSNADIQKLKSCSVMKTI